MQCELCKDDLDLVINDSFLYSSKGGKTQMQYILFFQKQYNSFKSNEESRRAPSHEIYLIFKKQILFHL